MKLSDRLQKIADEINQGETMADIGTDHGFLPVYLVESGKCPVVVMADISAASLEKAKDTARQHGYFGSGEQLDGSVASVGAAGMVFRTGDGLSVLDPYEVDTVVIAGMGGKLIRDIMAADMELTCSFRKFVLQPRIGQGHLRKWLTENGFHIVHECVVREGRHIPEIITALRPECFHDGGRRVTPSGDREDLRLLARHTMPDVIKALDGADGDSILWKVPPWMLYADGPVEDFLFRNMEREKEKLENVRRARDRDFSLEQSIHENMKYLQYLMEEYDYGE